MRVENRLCPVCRAIDSKKLYQQTFDSIAGLGQTNYVQSIVGCKKCGMAYSNPAPSNNDLFKYYGTFSNYANPQHGGNASPEMMNKWNRTYELIEGRLPVKYRREALEIGCATATGLSVFKSKGWRVMGIDPSSKAADLARSKYQIDVITGFFDVELLSGKGPFDVIILSHVLEHLFSPGLVIQDLHNLLKAGGLVYVEVPNLLKPYVPVGYFTFEHLNYFTPMTLSSLMAANSFEVDQLGCFDNSPEIDPFYPVISATFKSSNLTRSSMHFGSDYDAVSDVIKRYKEQEVEETSRLQSRVRSICRSTGKGRLAFFGAGIHTTQLISLTGLTSDDIACIFDNDPAKHGKHLNGIRIMQLEGPENIRKVVDTIIISSKAFEREIYEQIKHLRDIGIGVHRLYE